MQRIVFRLGTQPKRGYVSTLPSNSADLFYVTALQQRTQCCEGRNIRIIAQLQQPIDHLLVVQAAVGQGCCHGLIQAIEFALQPGDIGRNGLALPSEFIAASIGIPGLQVSTKLFKQRSPITGRVGDQTETVAELGCLKTVANYVQGGLLLADHQNSLMPSYSVGHYVDDCLAFPGTGWALNQHARLLPGGPDRPLLGWIRRRHQESLVFRRSTGSLCRKWTVRCQAQQRGHRPLQGGASFQLLQLMSQRLCRKTAQKQHSTRLQVLITASRQCRFLRTTLEDALRPTENRAQHINDLCPCQRAALVKFLQCLL